MADDAWIRKQISSITKNMDKVRFRDEKSDQDVSHLDMTPYTKGDVVEVRMDGDSIAEMRFPPELPVVSGKGKPAPTEMPAEQPPDQKPEEPGTEKKKIPHILTIKDNCILIADTRDGDKKYTLTGKALMYQKSFKPGDLINFSLDKEDSTKLTNMWKVDKDGNRPYHDDNNKTNGTDPTVELVKNQTQFELAVLDKAFLFVQKGKEQSWTDDEIKKQWSLVLELWKTGSTQLFQCIEIRIKGVKA